MESRDSHPKRNRNVVNYRETGERDATTSPESREKNLLSDKFNPYSDLNAGLLSPTSDSEPLIQKNSNFEAGQITEIYLENFMCHRKLSLKFGRSLNFIIGKNGSGA